MDKVLFSSKSDDWATPEGFSKKYGSFDLDPCADATNTQAPLYFDKSQDGLKQKWFGRVWMNPPYGRDIANWIEKAATCGCEVVCLLPARTCTRWFHEWCLPYGEIEFIKGRLKFGGSKNAAPFPSMVVVFKGQGK